MVGLLSTAVLFALLGLTQAVPDPDVRLFDDSLIGLNLRSLLQDEDDAPEIRKRDLEFNQYVPAYRLRGEPSCEELRAMWRLSKREARRATSTNNLPRTRPYSYGRLIAFAPNPHSRPYIYGEPRNFGAHNSVGFSPVKGSFNVLRGMLGVGAGRPGSLQRVRGMVASQRLPGETSKGKYDELRDMVLESHQSKEEPEEVMEESPSLRSSEMYQPVRRATSIRYQQQRQLQLPTDGFIGPLMPGIPGTSSITTEWRAPRPWNPRQKSCIDGGGSPCQISSDCACAGQYRCSKGRCKVFPVHPEIEDDSGTWFSGVLPQHELGAWTDSSRWNR